MVHRTVFILPIIAVLMTAFIGCGEDNVPVAITPSPPPSLPAQEVDKNIVGVWADVHAMNGIEFRSDGTWRPLYIYGMMLHDTPLSYYDTEPGGIFMTTADSKCILSTTYFTPSAATLTRDTCAYSLADDDSTLILDRAREPSRYEYRRMAIGDMVR